MITDKAALKAVPPEGLIRDYCKYALKQNSAPLAYHLLSAYVGLGSLIHSDFAIRVIDPQRPLRPTLWGKIVGPSGGDKSRSIEVLCSLLREVQPLILGSVPGSSEGLFDSVEQEPRQLITISDLGGFYAKTNSGYAEPIRDELLTYYDCIEVQRRLANGNDKRIENPRLSLLGAITPAHLEHYTDFKHWSGGFASRWVTVIATGDRFVPVAEPMDALWRHLIETWTVHSETEYGDCVSFTPEAMKLWLKVARGLHDRTRDAGSKVGAAYSRMGVTAVRCAAICAISMGRAKVQEPWLLDEECLFRGLNIAQFQRMSTEWALRDLCVTGYQRNRRELLEYIHSAVSDPTLRRPNPARMLSEISRHMRLQPRTLQDLLQGLEQEGSIVRLTANTTWFIAQDVDALVRREATMEPIAATYGDEDGASEE